MHEIVKYKLDIFLLLEGTMTWKWMKINNLVENKGLTICIYIN